MKRKLNDNETEVIIGGASNADGVLVGGSIKAVKEAPEKKWREDTARKRRDTRPTGLADE